MHFFAVWKSLVPPLCVMLFCIQLNRKLHCCQYHTKSHTKMTMQTANKNLEFSFKIPLIFSVWTRSVSVHCKLKSSHKVTQQVGDVRGPGALRLFAGRLYVVSCSPTHSPAGNMLELPWTFSPYCAVFPPIKCRSQDYSLKSYWRVKM